MTAAHQAAQRPGLPQPVLTVLLALRGSEEAVCLLPRCSAAGSILPFAFPRLYLRPRGREEERETEREGEERAAKARGDRRPGPLLGGQPLPRVAVDVTPQHHGGGRLDLSCAGRLLQHHAARLDPCRMEGNVIYNK